MSIAIYAGSFDPVTLGHEDIIKRASLCFDKLYVGVLNNAGKSPLFTVEERVQMLKEETEGIGNVEVISFGGLLVDLAKDLGANVLVRGLRAVSDFEYELQMAQMNRTLSPEIDTVFFATELEYAFLSSSAVREVANYDADISRFVTPNVAGKIKKKLGK